MLFIKLKKFLFKFLTLVFYEFNFGYRLKSVKCFLLCLFRCINSSSFSGFLLFYYGKILLLHFLLLNKLCTGACCIVFHTVLDLICSNFGLSVTIHHYNVPWCEVYYSPFVYFFLSRWFCLIIVKHSFLLIYLKGFVQSWHHFCLPVF